MNKSTLKLVINGAYNLSVDKILPLYASDKSVSWSSSDPTVATVDENGVVNGISEGEATITCTANLGGVTADCNVTVMNIRFVDMGGDVLWAENNIGADNYWEYGTYLQYAEIQQVYTFDGTTFTFQTENPDPTGRHKYKWAYAKGFTGETTAYIDNTGSSYYVYKSTSSQKLNDSDDVAYLTYGQGFRMPDKAELDYLKNNCEFTLETVNDVKCVKCTSNTTHNSIYFPLTGYGDGTGLTNEGTMAVIRSRQTVPSSDAPGKRVYCLVIDGSGSTVSVKVDGSSTTATRSRGFSVRAVKVKTTE